jgi:DNA-directed RNA polymerase specialized sigma24 family protein
LDASLRSRLAEGDEAAWAVVYADLVPRAVAKIRGRFGPASRWMTAEEAVASACRTTYRRLKEGLLAEGPRSYDDLLNLLLLIARNKFIDGLRRSEAEGKWAAARADRAADAAGGSPVVAELLLAEADGRMDECLRRLAAAVAEGPETVIFRGKLDGLSEREIAAKVEAELGGRMTAFMVREHWRAIRARFRRLLPEYLDEPPT